MTARQSPSRGDQNWFRDHPERRARVRIALPFEFDGWGRDSHRGTLTVARRQDGAVAKRAIAGSVGIEHGMPDDDGFLVALLDHIEAAETVAGQRPQLSPECHRQLLDAAGFKIGA